MQRTYNSLDAVTSDAFGTGWSSVLDMTVSPGQLAGDGSVVTQLVSYPDGERVAFGKNADGRTWSPPQGRYATFTAFQGGWRLDDKNDTLYQFTHALGGGRFGLDLIADAWGHVLQFTWTGGRITKITSNASHRSLSLAWSTPSGASNPHVAAVTTPDVTLGQDSTAITWQYSYSGDELTAVCNTSQSGQPCTRYDYKNGTNYPAVVLDSGPQSYWRLNETSGSTAASSALDNEGTDDATYVSVAQGIQPSPLAGVPSSVKAAGFDGTSSYVQVPASLADDAAAMSVSLWFNTTATGGVLLSQSANPVTSATTTGAYQPVLYIGSSGKLNGGFAASGDPMQSTAAYNDGNWHNVVLTSTGGQQVMYVDGTQVATKAGTVSPFIQPYFYLGAGFLGGSFPDQPHAGQSPAVATYFYGAMSDAATWARPLTAAEVDGLYTAGRYDAGLLQTVTRPSGKNFEQATYDDVTSAVTHVTDPDGGSWDVHAPTVTGSSRVYAAAVQGTQPIDYWRLGDAGTSTAVNQFVAGTATYSNVTQGVTGGPFSDMTVDGFNGTSSYLALPDILLDAGNQSVSLWFQTTNADGILLSTSADPISSATTTHGFTPNIYIGDDGNLLGEFDDGDAPIESDAPVNDGKWHNVVLAAGTNDAGDDEQSLYLDGKSLGTATEPISGGAGDGLIHDYVGAGFFGQDWADQPHYSTTNPTGYRTYFTGNIAEVAVYGHGLTQADVTHEWVAAQHSPGLTPVETATVTDPGSHLLTTTYDPGNSARVLSSTDGLGNTTSYGYNASGFQDRVTDPDGHVTDDGYDVRGNLVSKTTCQDQAAAKCESEYYAYLPDDTTPYLDPTIPANDAVKEVRDPRSSSMTDDTYKTTNEYNQAGYLVKTTTPPVPGHSAGRTTTYDYTDGTTTAGSGDSQGRIAPGGLQWRTTSPNVAVTQTLYDYDGNVVKTTNPDGLATTYTYDNIGRKLSQTVHVGGNTGDLTTTYAYDANGRVTQQTSPPVTDRITGNQHIAQVTTTYDADGDVISQVTADTGPHPDPSRTVSYTYNSHDQQDSSTDPALAVTHYSYDDYGNKASQTDPAGNETDYAYDPNGHLLTTTLRNYTGSQPNPQPPVSLVRESRAYDPAGRLASVTDAMGRKTSYQYTDNGLTATITSSGPDGGSYQQEQDTYDAAGNLTSQVTNNGATTTNYDVDAADRVASQTVDPGGLNRVTSYSYDPDDHIASQQVSQGSGDPVQSVDYTYDPMGNKTSQTVDDPGAGGPAGWWALDQASGTSVPDSSGTGNLATASAGVTWAGGAAVLPGTDGQRIATRGPVLDTTGSFTVSAWVKLAGSTGSNQIAVSQDAGQLSGFYLGLDSDTGTWRFVRPDADSADTSTFYGADSGLTAQTGVWTFLAGVFDANTGDMRMYAYVNNTAHSGTASDPSPIAANGPLEIGASKFAGQAGTNAFKGSVADVQVYPAALSADEVGFLNGQTRTGGDFSRDALVTTWDLDPRGLPTAQTDPDRVTTYYDHDEAGRLAATSGPPVAAQIGGDPPVVLRSSTATAYDTFGDAVATQDPDGNVTTYEYDPDGRQTAMTLPEYDSPDDSSPVNGRSTQAYNTLGQVTTQTDPLGNATHFSYDQLGYQVSQTDPDGGVATASYDADGEQLTATGPTGAQTAATWDFLGRQVTASEVERLPSLATYTTTASYTPTAVNTSGTWESSTTSPSGVSTSYGYDAAGETTQVTDGAGNVTHYSFDALGRQTAMRNADDTSQTATYDPAGNQVAQASLDATGHTVASQSAVYDGEGDILSGTDARGNATTFTYDTAGTLTAETQPVANSSGIVTSFGYDAAGNQTRYTDGLGNDWLTAYNTWNLPEVQAEPGTSQYPATDQNWDNWHTVTAYNADGDPQSVTRPGGVTVTYDYDSMGNLKTQTGSGATAPTANRSFTYDHAGNMLTAATTSTAAAGQPSNATSETYTWNDRGLLLNATGSAGSTSYTWNGDGQQASVNDAAGLTGYGYDSAGRLHTLNDPASGATLTYSYNNLSQISQVSYGTSADTRTYGYDTLHRLASDTLAKGSTIVASITYGYDTDSHLTSKVTAGGFAGAGSNTYSYDQAGRLTSWTSGSATTSYGYDGAGNRTKAGNTSYTFDARGELTSDGTSSYSYAADGDLSSQAGVASANDAYGQQAVSGSQSSTYDAAGRVVGVAAGGTATVLSYEGVTGQLAGDGTATYSWSPDGTLVGTAGTGGGKLDFTDRHTDVVGQFTAAGSTLSGSRAYGPWGTVTATGGSVTGSLGYQSQYTSSVTGQTDMGARWYSPALGGFTNKDTAANSPVPASASASPYGYAADDPLDLTDPSGHRIETSPDEPLTNADVGVTIAAAQYTASNPGAPLPPTIQQRLAADEQTDNTATANVAVQEKKDAQAAVNKVLSGDSGNVFDFLGGIGSTAAGLGDMAVLASPQCTGGFVAVAVTEAACMYVMAQGYSPSAAYGKLMDLLGIDTSSDNYTDGAWVGTGLTFLIPGGGEDAAAGELAADSPLLSRLARALGLGGEDAPTIGETIANAAAKAGEHVPGIVNDGKNIANVAKDAEDALSQVGDDLPPADHPAPKPARETPNPVSQDHASPAPAKAAPGAGGAPETPAPRNVPRLTDDTTSPTSCVGGMSFTRDTRVLLPDGTTTPISTLKPGDKVTARDTKTGTNQTQAVTAVEVNHDTNLYDLTVQTPHGKQVIHTTANHPLYDPYLHQWVPASKLKKGEHLQTPDGSLAVADGGTTPKVHDGWMWDLTVPGNNDHDFYVEPSDNPGLHMHNVVAGNAPVLVHNCNGAQDFEAFRPGVAQDPQLALPEGTQLVPMGARLEPGANYHFVVMRDGSLRAMQTDDLMEIANNTGFGPSGVTSQISGGAGHTSLAEAAPVHMAGTFDTNAEGQIFKFNSLSGHYMPSDAPGFARLENISIDSFTRHGLSITPDIIYTGRY
ncbi:MAG TPA: LamG-like jellyroll fold domain-containing protein [Amycolatopsis sp.]|nr:LamG-like jellyroll fold domain-containing protein [Amycolatopsis sp.]